MWTAPLVVLVICFSSILVFMTIIFLFVYIETRRATGQVCDQTLPLTPPSLSTLRPAEEVPLQGNTRPTRVTMTQCSLSLESQERPLNGLHLAGRHVPRSRQCSLLLLVIVTFVRTRTSSSIM